MREFRRLLAERQGDPQGRRWLLVGCDPLSDQIEPLSREDPQELGIVLVESTWKTSLRPYHKRELALVVGNLPHPHLLAASPAPATAFSRRPEVAEMEIPRRHCRKPLGARSRV